MMNDSCNWTTTRETHPLNKQKFSTLSKTTTIPELQRYFSSAVENIKYHLELLKKKRTMWPDQCDGVISTLDDTKFFSYILCVILEYSPSTVLNNEENQSDKNFVIKLYYVHGQSEKLQGLVTAFRPHCRASSKQAEKKRTTLLRNLELFTLHCSDILQRMAFLHEKQYMVTSVLDVLFSEVIEEHEHQPHAVRDNDVNCTHHTKSRARCLVLVGDGFVEEQHAAKQGLIEGNQILPTENGYIERINPSEEHMPSYVRNIDDRQFVVAGSYASLSHLKVIK